jgi:NAD(P)-dependent dehydrogenase (short-subunit alcohol dehydrogenase family)
VSMVPTMTTTAPIALVTGANRGLGRSTALELAHDGVDVVITYRANAEEADAVVAELTALGRTARAQQLDTSDVASFAAWIEQLRDLLAETGHERLDLLVNNAGTGLHAAFADTTESEFDAMVDVHLKGVFFLTQRLLPLLADGASIVNVSSGLARFSMAGSSAYAMAKGGVEVLTRYLAVELADRGITVNTLAPGAIATDFGGGMVRDTPQVRDAVAGMTALGRVGEADDIGTAIAGLFASRSRWITGQRIEASGGMHL